MIRFQTKNEIKVECRFCEYMSQSGNNPIDTPWMSSSKHFAFVSIGALIEGWSLVLPKVHIMNLSTEYKSAEFWSFATKAVSAVQENYGRVSVFEHGASNSDSQTSCGTGHAHLHIVPLKFSLFEAAQEFDQSMQWEKCRADEVAEKSQNQEYLFISDNFQRNATEGYICILQQETSQFFRKVIAAKIGKAEEFDYKKFKMIEKSNRSVETLSSHFWNISNSSRIA